LIEPFVIYISVIREYVIWFDVAGLSFLKLVVAVIILGIETVFSSSEAIACLHVFF